MGDIVTAGPLLAKQAGKYRVLAAIKGSPADFGYGIGGGLRKEDSALRGRINAAFKQIRADGTFDELGRK